MASPKKKEGSHPTHFLGPKQWAKRTKMPAFQSPTHQGSDRAPAGISDQISHSDLSLFGEGHGPLSFNVITEQKVNDDIWWNQHKCNAWQPDASLFGNTLFYVIQILKGNKIIPSLKKIPLECLHQGKQPRNYVGHMRMSVLGYRQAWHSKVAMSPVRMHLQIFILWQLLR